jgi:hypothetical protein
MQIVYNTFTDDLDYVGTSGGGGDVTTVTPNSGGAVSAVMGNINDKGLAANAGGNAYPMFSYNGGNPNVQWENRAYLSTYVVDPSTTNGSKGTFTTLAAAITQAIADGVAATSPGVAIYIRNVTITETISLSTNGINITILGTGGKSNQSFAGGNPIFNGSFTYSGNGNIVFSNIDMSSSATLTMSGSGSFTVSDCYSNCAITHSGNQFFFDNSTADTSSSFAISGTEFSVRNSSLLNFTITYSGSGTSSFQNSSFGGTLAGSTSGLLFFNGCYLPLTANTMTAGTIEVFNNTFGPHNFFGNTNLTYQKGASEIGNASVASRPAGSYSATFHDQYIGVTSTSSAVAITIPVSNVIKNQIFTVKDESGGAGTNNITVTAASGTIDGAANYVINTNYGEVSLMFDGTNYFTISQIAGAPPGVTANAFYAYASTTQLNVIGGGTPGPYTIPFDATTRNDGSAYDPTTGLYTAPSDGFYCFSGVVYLESGAGYTAGSEVIASSIGSVNSQVFYQKLTIDATNSSTNICLPFTWMLNMSMGETVGVQAYTSNGNKDVSIIGNSLSPSALRTFSSFSGFRVGT